MNAFAKIRKALNTGDANDLLTAMAALAELERAAAEPACIVESARIEGPTICRRLMWMREVGAGEKLYTTPPPAQPAPGMPTEAELKDVIREGALVTNGDAWTIAERVFKFIQERTQ